MAGVRQAARARGQLFRLAALSCSVAMAALAPATAARAADAEIPADVAAQDAGFGDIVVTALKRNTTIQETPIAISAITADSIANSGAQGIADLGATTPSLNFVDSGPSFRRVVVRGIRSVGEPMVGTYYDETPVTGMVGASNDAGGSTPELRLFDVERVEVLRGPQGTLYGSGSMGGTLRIIYNKPVMDRIEGAVDASLSNTNDGGWNYELNGMVNLPILKDGIALRAVGFYRRQDGYIDNIQLGIDNINVLKSYGGRFLLRLQPNSRWTVDLATYLNRTRSDTNAWDLQAGKYNSLAMTRQPITDDVNLYSATSAYDLDFATLTGSASYMKRNMASMSDVSRFMQFRRTPGSCAALANGGNACSPTQLDDYYDLVDYQSYSVLHPQQELNAWTAELRLSSNGDHFLNWTVGGFYSDRNVKVLNPQENTDPVTGVLVEPVQTTTSRHIDDTLKQVAAFGELSVDLTPRFNLTAGGRYFKYDKTIYGETTVPSIMVGARLTPLTRVAFSEDGWVFKFNGSYRITDDIMFYAEAAQGFRPGGANQVLGLAETFTGYRSDSLWNYEAGLKTTLFDRRMMLNVDAFQINWSNMQVTQLTPNGAFAYIGNAGRAKVKGIELETSIRVLDGFNVTGNFSYLDAKLTEDQNTGVAATSGVRGDRIPNVPKYLGGGAAQYGWRLSDALSGFARVDFNYVGGSWTEFRTDYLYARHVDSYTLVNARIGVEDPDRRWGLYLFATNLLNATAITNASASSISTGGNIALPGRTLVYSATPRTIGVNLRGNF